MVTHHRVEPVEKDITRPYSSRPRDRSRSLQNGNAPSGAHTRRRIRTNLRPRPAYQGLRSTQSPADFPAYCTGEAGRLSPRIAEHDGGVVVQAPVVLFEYGPRQSAQGFRSGQATGLVADDEIDDGPPDAVSVHPARLGQAALGVEIRHGQGVWPGPARTG